MQRAANAADGLWRRSVARHSICVLTGAQVVPAVTSTAYASGYVVGKPEGREINGSIVTSGITASAAYIYAGAVGVNGTAVITFSPVGSSAWEIPPDTVLTEEQYAALLTDGLYLIVQSATQPNGEIRGKISLAQSLTGAQEVPPNTTLATGTAIFTANPVASAGSSPSLVLS